MNKHRSIRTQGYDVLSCHTRHGKHCERKRTAHRLEGGLWLALQTMLRMSEEIEAEFYDHACMPLKSQMRLISYDEHENPLVVSLMRLEHRLSDHTDYKYVMRHHRGEGDELGAYVSNHNSGLFLAINAISRKCREYECHQKGKGGFLTLNREEKGKDPFDKVILIVGV